VFAALLLVTTSFATVENLPGFLLARDLVVDGILVAASSATRHPAGGCGATQVSPLRGTEYRVAVRRTLFGSADDSTIVIMSLGQDHAAIGSRVIGYADRLCVDDGRLWGGVLRADSDAMFDSLGERSEESGFEPFRDAAGVAMVRLGAYSRIDETHFSYECDSLGWIFPAAARIPRTLYFRRSLQCSPNTGRGDTLIVPIPRGFSATRLELAACPQGWHVRQGTVTGLGVSPNELRRAIEQRGDTLLVRPVRLRASPGRRAETGSSRAAASRPR
jgi:hypothetical protein